MRQEKPKIYVSSHRKYSSYEGEIRPELPNILLRNFRAASPNQKWLTDLTAIGLPAGKVYLSPVIDCFDGMVHIWTIGTSPNAQLVNNMCLRRLWQLYAQVSIRLFILIEDVITASQNGANMSTMLGLPNLHQGKGVHQTIQLVKDFLDG